MNTKCNFCGNKNFNYEKVQYIYRHDDQFLIVNDVPCEQCSYCGEKYFASKVLLHIEEEFQNIYINGKKPQAEVIVPVERFPELHA